MTRYDSGQCREAVLARVMSPNEVRQRVVVGVDCVDDCLLDDERGVLVLDASAQEQQVDRLPAGRDLVDRPDLGALRGEIGACFANVGVDAVADAFADVEDPAIAWIAQWIDVVAQDVRDLTWNASLGTHARMLLSAGLSGVVQDDVDRAHPLCYRP